MQVQGKVFVVTGAGNGIGQQVALGLLARGARVAAGDLSGDGLERTRDLAAAGDRLTTEHLDVADVESVRRFAEAARGAHGSIDGLLNVAGVVQRFVPFAQLERADIERVMNVNFWGVVNTCHEFLPDLAARPQACIVNVSSMGGFVPVPGQTAYGASKAAVKLFTEGLYAELRTTGVAVSIVFPGAIATQITQNSGVTVPGAGSTDTSKITMTSPERAAEIIVEEAVIKGRYRVLVGKDATMLDRLSRLAPHRATDVIAKRMASLLG